MSVSRNEEIENPIEALRAVDTETLRRIADETGIDERTLWRYRAGETAPSKARGRILRRALALSSESSSDGPSR